VILLAAGNAGPSRRDGVEMVIDRLWTTTTKKLISPRANDQKHFSFLHPLDILSSHRCVASSVKRQASRNVKIVREKAANKHESTAKPYPISSADEHIFENF
jgi:hypothetical protein